MNRLDKATFKKFIIDFDFVHLFNELGWDHLDEERSIKVDDEILTLKSVAHKAGFRIFICHPDAKGNIVPPEQRKKLETQISKLYQEHLIIFVNSNKTEQVWQLAFRQPYKPIRLFPTTWRKGQDPELLYQRAAGLFFTLDEEDKITIVDVTERVSENFFVNTEKVTKKFYQSYNDQHKAFQKFIEGLEDKADKEWYTSLMLNRLMFVYFIQKKGFLDNNLNYLQDKLKANQQKRGRDKFYKSFYRNFLKKLFHEGLGKPHEGDDGLFKEIGRIPYLNGGLFDVHDLEEKNKRSLDIRDNAFERVFNFFDQWDWHLDTRPQAAGNEINPDVIGYIFEQYINEKAEMGAYYTKEDITEYISKNSVIPWLFDEAKKHCANAFTPNSALWEMLRNNPDRYIYPAVKHGISHDLQAEKPLEKIIQLPEYISAGLDTSKPNLLERRKRWNETALSEVALPNEIWHEVIERRRHYDEVRRKIATAEINSINDFITYNLDIRQFAQDAITNYEGSDFIQAIYTAIAGRKADPKNSSVKPLMGVTILDPTCGSGAFLFAALNVLEPLYSECINRMREFVDEDDKRNGKKFTQFRIVLNEIAKHHNNERYYIYKSIILNNLYGVDIMKEAVEITKLRLFLKLVAEVDKIENVEPLPDIDFNIRTGNTLIGFTNLSELEKGLRWKLDFEGDEEKIKEGCDIVALTFRRYKEIQLSYGDNYNEFRKAKDDLTDRLKELNRELNKLLHKQNVKKEYDTWLSDNRPFHWFAEFYEIVNDQKGFDVIIGNPPYTQIPIALYRNYLRKFETALEEWSRDENLYTLILEQSFVLSKKDGVVGMILPLSITFSTKKPFPILRKKIKRIQSPCWWLHFDRIPSALFGNDVRTRCTILLKGSSNKTSENHTTSLTRWESNFREVLFEAIRFSKINVEFTRNLPKVGSQIQADTLQAIFQVNMPLEHNLSDSLAFSQLKKIAPNFPQSAVYVGGTAYNWFPAWREIPETFDEKGKPSLPARTAGFRFSKKDEANIVFALLCSSLGYWWWAITSDGFNLKKWLLSSFPISLSHLSNSAKEDLAKLGEELRIALRKQYVYKDNKGKIGNFFLPACHVEIEKIDRALSKSVVGLSPEFFDDIKFFNANFSRAVVSLPDDLSDDED